MAADLDDMPVLLPARKRGSLSDAAVEAASVGLSSLVSAASLAADRVPLGADTLLRHLHRKLHVAKQAEDRAWWFGGRLYNAATGERRRYISLSGGQLAQVLALITDVPSQFPVSRNYLLRVDLARAAHDRLGAHLGVDVEELSAGL
jgi:hypothetical protein